MNLNKIILYIFTCVQIISANNVTNLKTEMTATSEISLCENSTAECYSETTTEQVVVYASDRTTEQELLYDSFTESTNLVTNSPTASYSHGENRKENNNPSEKPCNCDITTGVCNINCCCDTDCSKWEREAFSECIPSKTIPTSGLCLSTEIIYKNNTPYPVVKSEDGLFCISKDNFPERNRFLEQGIIRSERTFEKFWRRRRHYYWKTYSSPLLTKLIKSDTYKYGDPVWVFFNATSTVQQLTYPATVTSSMCSQERRILYLQNFESNCVEIISMNKEQCLRFGFLAGKYYDSQTLIASPSLINNTDNLEESPSEAFVTMKYELCRGSSCFAVDKFPTPEFDPVSKKCKNILKSLDLEMRHNGSKGITDAKMRVSLSSVGPEQPIIRQTFRVQFLPARQANTSVMFMRSGTPGYRVGLPVITGFLQGDRVIRKSYLTVLSGPNCSETTKVLFGENSRTQCLLQVPVESTRNCTRFKEQIVKLMMQMNGEVIGTSGDPDSWLKRPLPTSDKPLLSNARGPCSIPTSLSLDFLYSYSGSLWQPTASIIGVSSSLAGQQFVDCSSSVLYCRLRLINIISFTDVSQPAVSKFTAPPVVKIKLPPDFFYPFSSAASCRSLHDAKDLRILFIFISGLILYQCVIYSSSL